MKETPFGVEFFEEMSSLPVVVTGNGPAPVCGTGATKVTTTVKDSSGNVIGTDGGHCD